MINTTIKYIVVDKKIIPVSTRKSKYQEILDNAKILKDNEAIAIQEDLETSLISIMSYMRMQNYKVSLRTVNKIKTLYISRPEPKVEPKPKKV